MSRHFVHWGRTQALATAIGKMPVEYTLPLARTNRYSFFFLWLAASAGGFVGLYAMTNKLPGLYGL
jgi:hypothetical protein